MADKQFPLEPIFEERKYLNLYEESDLISNIKGDYEDKSIYDWAPISNVRQEVELPQEAKTFQTDAALGREEARESVRQKRSAAYLQDDPNQTFRKELQSRRLKTEPTALFQQESASDYRKYSQNLSQERYILADLRGSRGRKPKKSANKDSYDFLRKSQIYQEKEQKVTPRQTNQELDLRKLTGEKEKK
ncbi:hypothetical protein JEQ21_07155 [Streptococcus sp. 121]|uniref:hypothetical protein n=1 Tax=Streptococcus sp. 121 TaxID=2797637 RepID=UPI0018F0AD1B|nr:hypothetical protein [Streptococcus sp. 121]MBJ6746233.1 hypothetical protein [Streptococcus sp. 121]